MVNSTRTHLCVCRVVLISVSRPWAGSEPQFSYMDSRPDLSHILPLPSQRWSRYQIILLGVNNWQCTRLASNQGPSGHQFDTLLLYHQATPIIT